MCDLGLAIGLISGGLQAAGAADAADSNKAMINQQARLDHAAQAREFIVSSNASRKEAYDASLEGDRNKSFLKTLSGSMGSAPAARNAEQSRQGALSIYSARDRAEAATANHAFGGAATTIQASNRKAVESYTPMEAFAQIAGSGIAGYGGGGGSFSALPEKTPEASENPFKPRNPFLPQQQSQRLFRAYSST